MKIFFPFKIRDIGGTTTFAKKFKEGMEQRGHEVFFDYRSDYDVLFMIVQAPFKYLIEAKRKKKRIIQRLDGVHYWSIQGPMYFLFNLKAKIIRHFFCDFTIYQSKYSKYCAEKFLGKKKNDPSAIIYNGVDLNIFSPIGDTINLRDNPKQKIFFTASAFRRENQILPIIEALEIYSKKFDSNFKFLVAGNFTKNITYIQEKYKSFKNIVFLGKINNIDLPKYERTADVFLFTHSNPPCPNNVIESLACGLPICGIADGAMPEIIQDTKIGMLVPATGDAFWLSRKYDTETFAENLDEIIKNQQLFSENARQFAQERFSLDLMIDSYIKVLENK